MDERVVGGQARDRHRPRVRHVGQQRAEGDDELRAERLGEVDDQRGRTCASASTARRPERGRGRAGRAGCARRRSRPRATRSRACGLDELDLRPRGLEVEEVLGVDAGEARGAERGAEELERRGGRVAGVVPAGEGAHESRGAQAVGAVLPDQRRHPDHGTSWPCVTASGRSASHVARGRRRGRRLRLHPQGPPGLAGRARRTSRSSCATARARSRRRVFRDADLHAGRFDRGDLVRVAGRVERFRDELQVDVRAIARAPAGDADPAAFLPVAYRDLDELDGFLEHLAGEVRDAPFKRLDDACWPTAELRAALRARRARAPATTPTSAGCSSTPSPSRRSRSRPARCTRAWTRTSC